MNTVNQFKDKVSPVLKQKKLLKIGGEKGFEIETIHVQPKPKKSFTFLISASEIGFSIALPIILGAFFGSWLDKKFNSHPKITLSLIFVGIFFAFTNLFLIVRQYTSDSQKKKNKELWHSRI